MWDTFCELAQEGGPPHRGTMQNAPEEADPEQPLYRFVLDEIIRGIHAVSGLRAEVADPGWVAVMCDSPGMARWLCEAIEQENVEARHEGNHLYLPISEHFTLKGEIKNVITVVAKTTHYWQLHLSPNVKRTLAVEEKFNQIRARVRNLFGS